MTPTQPTPHAPDDTGMAHLGQIIAVASGKGGVGKSTLTTNLALALAAQGAAVGLVDADLYGPSVPGMLGIQTGKNPSMSPSGKVMPAQAHGIKVISMGMLTDDDKPEVVSQSESGTGADAGKTRLIMRSSQRVWAAEIAADGTAHEIPAPRAAIKAATAGNSLRDRIRAHLTSLSAADLPLTYGQLAREMGLYMPGSIAKVAQALEATMVEDAETGAPFLAALVVSKVGDRAAKGFHQQAHALGRGPADGEDAAAYHRSEFRGAIALLAVTR